MGEKGTTSYDTDHFASAFEPGENRFGIRVKEIIFPEDFILKGGDRSSHIKLKCTLFQVLRTDEDNVYFESLRRSITNKKMFCDIWTPEISDIYKRGKYLFFEVMCYLPRSSEDKIIHLDRVIQASPGIQGMDVTPGTFVQEFFTIIKSGMEIDDALARVSYLMEHPDEVKDVAPPPPPPPPPEPEMRPEKEAKKEKPKGKKKEEAEDQKRVKKKKKSKKEMKSEELLGKVLTELWKKEEEEEEKVTGEAPRCPQCSEGVEPDWMNCPSCGIKLREEPQPESAQTATPVMDEALKERMGMALELANEEVESEAKEGVTSDRARDLLQEARSMLEKGDLDRVETGIREAMAALDESRQEVEARRKAQADATARHEPEPAPEPGPASSPQAAKEGPEPPAPYQTRLSLPPLPDMNVPELWSPSPIMNLSSKKSDDEFKPFVLPSLPRLSWDRGQTAAPSEPSGTQVKEQDLKVTMEEERKEEIKREEPPKPVEEPPAPEPSTGPTPPKADEVAERVEERPPTQDLREGKAEEKPEPEEGKKEKKKKKKEAAEEKTEEKEKAEEVKQEIKGSLTDLLSKLKDFK